MISIAGVVFSLPLVALTVVSSQFGPRLRSNFMRNKSDQAINTPVDDQFSAVDN